jgi:hypothetical protein
MIQMNGRQRGNLFGFLFLAMATWDQLPPVNAAWAFWVSFSLAVCFGVLFIVQDGAKKPKGKGVEVPA